MLFIISIILFLAKNGIRPDFVFPTKEIMHQYLLKNDFFYPVLRNISAEGRELNPSEAGKLNRMILRGILNYSLTPISPCEFKLLAKHIEGLCPLEKQELYYCSKGSVVSGRLYCAYINLKGELRNYGLLASTAPKRKKIRLEQPNNVLNNYVDKAVEAMQSITEPFEKVIELWRETYLNRLRLIETSDTLFNYTDMFAFLKTSKGIDLLMDDVNKYFTNDFTSLLNDGVSEFKINATKVLKILLSGKQVDQSVKTIAQKALNSRDDGKLNYYLYFLTY